MGDSTTTFDADRALLSACPQCGHFVRMPAVVKLSVVVRCPVCQHAYALRSVLPDEIPELQVLSGAEADDVVGSDAYKVVGQPHLAVVERPIPAADRLSIPEVLLKGSKRRSHRRGDASGDAETAGVAAANSTGADRALVSRPRHSRRAPASNQSAREFFKIVLGALLALPVAQLIIWWGLGLDPFRLGPSVSRVVPFIVPSRLSESEADESQM